MGKSHQNQHRETRILQTVACPACGRPIGQACGWTDRRPRVCLARKQAWQALRAQLGSAKSLQNESH